MPLIDVGRKAPAFSLKDQDLETRTLSAFAGHPLVMFFYPKDATSGCTKEACQFRDLHAEFAAAGAAVVGVSILDEASKRKFASKEGLTFPLLADVKLDKDGHPAVSAKYGVWVEKSMYGKTYMGIERTTYLIGADGKVAARWDKVKVPGHADAVLEAVRGL